LRRSHKGSKEPYQIQEYSLLAKPGSYSTLKWWVPEHDAATSLSAPPCSHTMIQCQIYIEKDSLGLKGAISNSRIFTFAQSRELFNLEVVGARA
jgi:hypothetical protein